jgi:hypothetical protein
VALEAFTIFSDRLADIGSGHDKVQHKSTHVVNRWVRLFAIAGV